MDRAPLGQEDSGVCLRQAACKHEAGKPGWARSSAEGRVSPKQKVGGWGVSGLSMVFGPLPWGRKGVSLGLGTQGGGGGELQVKGYKLSGIRGIISENLMYHIVSRVNNGLQE